MFAFLSTKNHQYDGEATIGEALVFITNFDPANREVALHPTRIAAGANRQRAEGNGVADVVGHLATMVTAIVGGRPLAPHGHQNPTTPQKSTHQNALDIATSPAVPSPTKLPRFLEHAEVKLGISNARTFEFAMRQNGYGPDIMHMLDDQALVDCGMTKGDVLRMKKGALEWWKGPDAKRKRTDSIPAGGQSGQSLLSFGSAAGLSHVNDPVTPPSKKIAFEHRYEEGGATRFWGPQITPSDHHDKHVWLRAAGNWIPMPPGYRTVHDYEYDEEEEDGAGRSGSGGSGSGSGLADDQAAAALMALQGSQAKD